MKLKSDCGIKSDHIGQRSVQGKWCGTKSKQQQEREEERMNWSVNGKKLREGERNKDRKGGKIAKRAEALADSQS